MDETVTLQHLYTFQFTRNTIKTLKYIIVV